MHACMHTHIHTVHTYVHTYITLHISTVSFAHIPMTLALTLYLGTYTSKVIPNIFRLYRLWLYSGYFCIYGFLCEYPDDTPSEIVFCVFLHLRFPVCISHPPPLWHYTLGACISMVSDALFLWCPMYISRWEPPSGTVPAIGMCTRGHRSRTEGVIEVEVTPWHPGHLDPYGLLCSTSMASSGHLAMTPLWHCPLGASASVASSVLFLWTHLYIHIPTTPPLTLSFGHFCLCRLLNSTSIASLHKSSGPTLFVRSGAAFRMNKIGPGQVHYLHKTPKTMKSPKNHFWGLRAPCNSLGAGARAVALVSCSIDSM